MAIHPSDSRLRLGVVQLDGIPHAQSSQHNLWTPAEPLVDVSDRSRAHSYLPEISTGQLFAVNASQVYQRLIALSTEAVTSHLDEILAFLVSQAVDIAVFPEYLVPVDYLPKLVTHSRGRAIVAGLEYIRNNLQAVKLAEAADGNRWDAEDLLGRNVATLVENERVHLITKRTLSEDEDAVAGTGPYVTQVELRGRHVCIGVAVCMDYLRLEEEVRALSAEILCIPAYSPQLKPFIPDAPRDHVRLLANCAAYGGSRVMIPGLRGPLIDELGVLPISRTYEAVIIVDFDRYPQRPSSLRRTENLLRLRAEILERDLLNSVAMAAIQEPAEVEDSSGLAERLASWLQEVPSECPLAQAFKVYRDSLARGYEDTRLHRLAFTHLIVEPNRRSGAIRVQQARYIVKQLKQLPTYGNSEIGRAVEAYSELLAHSSHKNKSPIPTDMLVAAQSEVAQRSGGQKLGEVALQRVTAIEEPGEPTADPAEGPGKLAAFPSALAHQAETSRLITLAQALDPPPEPPDDLRKLAGWVRRAGEWIDEASELAKESEVVAFKVKSPPQASFFQAVTDVCEALDAVTQQLREVHRLDHAALVVAAWEDLLGKLYELVADSLER